MKDTSKSPSRAGGPSSKSPLRRDFKTVETQEDEK